MLENLEQEIQDKGLTKPRVTIEKINNIIIKEDYYNFPDTTVTICLLTLKNRFTVTGESACASPENFNIELGQKIARNNAFDKIWQLEGYLLKEKLYKNEI